MRLPLLSLAAALCLTLSAGAWAQPAVSVPATSAAAPAVPLGELGDAVTPQAYRLDFAVDPAKERFSGRTEIDVVLKDGSSGAFHMHGRSLAMGRVSARAGGQDIPGRWAQVDDSGVARVDFGRALPSGQPVTLMFEYEAGFNDSAQGLFRAQVAGRWYSWSQFQSIDARAAFPGFDQPSFKTPFSLTVRTPPGLMAVGNAPQTGTTREGGMDVHHFAPTLPLPTYLVAVMVGPFTSVAEPVRPTAQRASPLPLRVISTAQNAGRLDFALKASQDIVVLLEDYFADAFPYPKLDQITSPLMPGAMENAGADLYNDAALVMEEAAPVEDKRRLGMYVAHELSHQWFGDLVTPRWWDDIWLNESFANWMGYRIGNEWRPDLKIGTGGLAEGFDATKIDELSAGRPIRQPIETNAQIDAAFDSITYGKGGQVVAMIAAFMGDERFRDGVRRYMAAHRNGNATSRDFFAAMAQAGRDPRLVPAMQSFIEQQGVPLLTFSRVGGGLTVTQSRYAPLGDSAPALRWGVPMCLRSGEARQCQLLVQENETLTFSLSGALVPNAGGTGYYRFELADADWEALVAAAGSLSAGEALALSDSLGASVRAGRSPASRLAALARVLVRHPDSHAADAATGELTRLTTSGLIDTRARKGWRRYLTGLYRPLLDTAGLELRAGAYAGQDPDSVQRRLQIVEFLAGPAGDKALRARLDAAAAAFLGGDTKALDPMWFDKAFDAYVSRRKMKGARALLEAALASDDPSMRPQALGAVAMSGQLPVARWLLAGIDDKRLRPDEQRSFLPGVLASRPTARLGYDWMRANLDTLLGGSGGIFYASKLPDWLGRFCSVDMANEFASDLRPRFKGRTGELGLERAIARVRNCGVLRDQRGAAISADFAALK